MLGLRNDNEAILRLDRIVNKRTLINFCVKAIRYCETLHNDVDLLFKESQCPAIFEEEVSTLCYSPDFYEHLHALRSLKLFFCGHFGENSSLVRGDHPKINQKVLEVARPLTFDEEKKRAFFNDIAVRYYVTNWEGLDEGLRVAMNGIYKAVHQYE